MELDFADRHVVVTGASGALGGAVVEVLLEQGATCHLPGRSTGLAERFREAPGDSLHAAGGIDLTDENTVTRFYDGLPSLWASIHCAGGFSMAPLAETTWSDLSELWSINTVSTFLCCREAVKVMRSKRGGGRIVNVAARPALEPRTGSGMAAYTASKAGVSALTEALAEELAEEAIWVNAVAPSILDTEANRRAMPRADHSRWAKVGEVAETIAFLASPCNASTRGAVVPVYGRS